MLPFHSEAMKEKGSERWRDGPTVPTSIAHTNSLQGRGNRLHEEGFVRLLYLLLVSLTYVLQKQCDVGGQGRHPAFTRSKIDNYVTVTVRTQDGVVGQPDLYQ